MVGLISVGAMALLVVVILVGVCGVESPASDVTIEPMTFAPPGEDEGDESSDDTAEAVEVTSIAARVTAMETRRRGRGAADHGTGD